MAITIRNASIDDLDTVSHIEAECFPKAEAATRNSFEQRLRAFPESFFIAEENGNAIGFINGCATDSLTIFDEMFDDISHHKPDGKYQTVFGLDVMPENRKTGIAAILMEHMINEARAKGRSGVILTCKESLIHYYEKFGYRNLGISKSVHGGAVWYDMLLNF
ncbi:GNAT family N-acetyltransferase [Lachnospiraceae bacterium NSJ-143]|nr:GNAT family N-acetyltransferase [Lachnospiraceae bacterium NSJ-143]